MKVSTKVLMQGFTVGDKVQFVTAAAGIRHAMVELLPAGKAS